MKCVVCGVATVVFMYCSPKCRLSDTARLDLEQRELETSDVDDRLAP